MAILDKQKLDFFPFDTDFFEDEKIVALSSEFGIKGEITAVKLLCEVYRNGYYLPWSESVRIKLLSKLQGISSCLLDNIVSRLIKWGFFDKAMFESAMVLTSRGIQTRYFSSYKRHSGELPYLLVNVAKTGVNAAKTRHQEEPSSFDSTVEEQGINATEPPPKSVKTTKMGFFATETGVFAAKTPINDAGSTQRKEKKRKDSSLHSESMSDSRPTNKSELIEDYDAFVSYFNESVAGTAIQRIRVISAPRKRLLDARCKEYGKESVANVIKKAAASSFLNGSASEKFVATFDWLIRPSNFLKTLEGNYDNRECINANQTQCYGTISNNGYRSREDVLTGAANIIRELREEARLPETELPVV